MYANNVRKQNLKQQTAKNEVLEACGSGFQLQYLCSEGLGEYRMSFIQGCTALYKGCSGQKLKSLCMWQTIFV